MKLFGQLVRTAVNVVTLPIEVAKDVVDPFSRVAEGQPLRTQEAVERLKREAEEQKKNGAPS